MSNYILKYSRDERVKYISHLDFVRLFHRTVRRADLPFVFSQGFNPHPIMTVAQPLSVGVTSDCEYMKVGFELDCDGEYIKEHINASFPPGYKIVAAKKVNGKEIDINSINSAEYIVEAECNSNVDTEEFLKNKELIVMKKSKSGVKESDIRPYIYDLESMGFEGNILKLRMALSVGNTYNLKPQSVMDALEKYVPNFKVDFIKVHRSSMMCDSKELM